MAPAKASGQKKAKSANGYRLPDPIPAGEIVTGLTKKKSWRVGKSIGVGGFGEIYLCSEDTSKNVGEDATLAMKIEPHENGPLFVEMNFYLRAASPDKVAEFKKEKGLTSLGMPVHCGSGSHMFKGDRYRFLIMERFGKDLQKIFQTGKKKFPPKAAYTIAIKVIDTLEYIHNQGYCHNDIKAQNLLLGHGRTRENDVYLVDFGLVSKYHRDGVHLEYKPDARKAHDGTIEYTSRDAHIGAHSRRSDLEILGYNLVHWMSGTLPWMDNLTDCKYVHTQKNGFMNDVPIFLQRCFGDNDYPSVLEDFLEYTKGLQFDTEPDYDELRDMFKKALKDQKLTYDGKLDFSSPKKTSTTKKVGSPQKSPTKAKAQAPTAKGKRSASKESPAKKTTKKAATSSDKKSNETPKRASAGRRKAAPVVEESDENEVIDDTEEEEAEEEVVKPKGRKRANKSTESKKVKPSPAKKIKMEEKGCQTSPAFVAEAKVARKAAKRAAAAAVKAHSSTEEDDVASEGDKVVTPKRAPQRKKQVKKPEANSSVSSADDENPEMAAFVSKAVKAAQSVNAKNKRAVRKTSSGVAASIDATDGGSNDDSENDQSSANNPTPAMRAMMAKKGQKGAAASPSPAPEAANPTPAMLALMKKRKESAGGKKTSAKR